jgi:hypothetical protein
MKKCLWFALVVAVAASFSVSELYARGGGRGGARGARPGGKVGSRDFSGGNFSGGAGNKPLGGKQFGSGDFGGLKPSDTELGGSKFDNPNFDAGKFGKSGPKQFENNFVKRDGNGFGESQHKVSQLEANFASKNAPFSSAWYADHPAAWQYTHPHADAWAAASLAAAAAWLGGGAYPVYAEEDSTVQTSDDETAAQDDLQSQSTDESASDEATDESSNDSLTAAELAARGNVDLPSDTEFLPLGVFAMGPAHQEDASAVAQFAVSKDGILRGSYADLITDQGQTIYGAVDKPSGRVAWTVGRDGKAVFETTLASLTSSAGPAVLNLPNGTTRDWTLARYEDAPNNAQ